MRLQIQQLGGVTILNDAYNANPASMMAAIRTLLDLPAQGRRVAVLGDMREMGESSDRLHREMGQHVGKCEIDFLICVGEKSALIAQEAEAVGFSRKKIAHFSNTAAAIGEIAGYIRFMGFERLTAPISDSQVRRAG